MAVGLEDRRFGKSCLCSILLALSPGIPVAAVADYHTVDDIKPFGLLDVSGHIRTGYLFDDRERDSTVSGSFERQTSWEEELYLLTESFIYHPGFLNMDIGGGPIFAQQQFDSPSGEMSNDETLFNFLARLNFLELKNYPFSLYYQRSHPSVTTSLAGRFLTENDAYGVNGRVFDLFGGSTSLRFDAQNRMADGAALGAVVDEETDTASVLVETSFRDSDRLELRYDWFDTMSGSGSPGLPIFRSTISQEIGEIRSRNFFGRDDRFEIFQVLRRLQQETESVNSTSLENQDYLADFRWRFSEQTRSYFRYRRNDREHTFSDSKSQDFEFGVVGQASESIKYDAVAEHASAEQTGFDREESAIRGSLNYSREFGFGTAGLSGSLRGARTDQRSGIAGIPVFDESHVLNGTTPIDLANDFAVGGSVIVSNAVRTQVFVEGLDYRLLVIGSATSIQRLIGGNITDGETIVVDYTYETSGTAEFDTTGASISLNVGFLNTLNAFLHFDMQDTNLRNGAFTNPINDRDSLEFGISASNQFLDGWSLNGQFRHRDQDEEISPFVSDALDVSLATSLRGTWKLTISGSLAIVDYENSVEDVDQVTYRLGLSGRLMRSMQLSYDAGYLSDTGGTLSRTQLQHRLNFQWAYRQVRFVLRGQYSDDELGPTKRNDTQVTAQVTRHF